ncbi:DUF2071 domain-containing protein [Kitasatospora viridis]|nr:DUF2071 domain-containing protein [Kitasatospora viridis]
MASTVERRLLVNYRVDPTAAARVLPTPLRPKLTQSGWALGGVCLIRLGGVRPSWAPRGAGLRVEGAAHRIAVEWDGPDGVRTGVYIPRRDTGSRLAALAGGRLFPGPHGLARFRIEETAQRFSLSYASRDGEVRTSVTATVADELRDSRLFADMAEAAAFFRTGAHGLSEPARPGSGHLDVVELRTKSWEMTPCRVDSAESSYFDDPHRFELGSATLDSVFLMRDLPADWTPRSAVAVRQAA